MTTRTVFLSKLVAAIAVGSIAAFLVVAQVDAAPSATLTASSTDLKQGESVTLTWSSSDATSCTGNGFSTGGATSGSVTVTPANDTTYSVTCSKTARVWQQTGSTSGTTAGACSAEGPFSTCGSSAPQDTACATLNATCATGTRTSLDTSCRVQQSSYACRDTVQTYTATASVAVRDVSVVLVSNPNSVQVGGNATLSWSVTGATSCTSSGFDWGGRMSGSVTVNPTETTAYSLVCNNGTPVVNGTWVYKETDTSDLSCYGSPGCVPNGNNTRGMPYEDLPTCSPRNPSGTQCYSSGMCKNGYWDANANQSPYITDIYECTASGGVGSSDADSASVTVESNPLTAQCSATPDTISIGGTVTWSAVVSGGTGPYTYVWSGTDSLTGSAASITKTYSTTGAKTGSVRVTSGDGQDTGVITCNNSVTVTDTQGADLTAGSVSASGARYNQSGTLSAPIQNIGNQAAAASNAFYQVIAPISKGNASGLLAVGALAAGASQTVTTNYKFSYEGDYQVRFCADWEGAVPESNEGNNCGPWRDISIIQTFDPDSLECQVSDTTVSIGDRVTYTAVANGSVSGPYEWNSNGNTNFGSGNTVTRTFTEEGSFPMSVSASGETAQCLPVTVATNWCVSGTPELNITASKTRVQAGTPVTISWSATGVNGQNATCSVTGPGVNWVNQPVSPPPSCSVAGSDTPTIQTQSTYTLTCGAYNESVTVNVIPKVIEF